MTTITTNHMSTGRAISAQRSNPVVPVPTMGWDCVATAIHSILYLRVPMFMRLTVEGQPSILLDFRDRTFAWKLRLEDFLRSPGRVQVETQATTADAPPLYPTAGLCVDPLLWLIGLNAFGGTAASWLRPGKRYKLSRWPNVTELEHSSEQVQMMALLGNHYLSASELAEAARLSPEKAQRLINTLSLMGVLIEAQDSQRPARLMANHSVSGFFRRLRDKLGR